MDSQTGSNHSKGASNGKAHGWSPSLVDTHLTLEPVGSLGPLGLHILRQHGVFVQFLSIVEVASESLCLFSMPEVHHVHGQVKVALTLFKPFLIFNLEMQQTSLIG